MARFIHEGAPSLSRFCNRPALSEAEGMGILILSTFFQLTPPHSLPIILVRSLGAIEKFGKEGLPITAFDWMAGPQRLKPHKGALIRHDLKSCPSRSFCTTQVVPFPFVPLRPRLLLQPSLRDPDVVAGAVLDHVHHLVSLADYIMRSLGVMRISCESH